MRDLYTILGLPRNAVYHDIIEAYKSLGTNWHPDLHPSPESEVTFQALSEAFQILIDPNTRKQYDQYGDVVQGNRNGREVYFEQFGTIVTNPSVPLLKDPPIIREFALSLEELYVGKTKKFNVTKRIIHADGNLTQVTKKLEIVCKAGWRAGTKITFPREGDIRINVEPADMVFILKEKPHTYFTREKNDLVYVATITLKQALCGIKLTIPTLDGDTTTVQTLDPIKPDYVHIMQGKGMPNSKSGKFGDLHIKFLIQFPTALEKSQKDFIKSALQSVAWK